MSFILAADSSCDLPASFIKEKDIKLFSLSYNMEGRDRPDDLFQGLSSREFYNELRSGKMSVTSQVNSYEFAEKFEEWAKEGKEILYIAFSSGLSGTYHSGMIARDEVLLKYPEAKIYIVDTKAASGGLGLLLLYAQKMKDEGKSAKEIADAIEELKLNLCHFFTVDDLDFLKRGGRISSAVAFFGGMLNIKPVMYVDDEGHLIPWEKARGRKNAIKKLADNFSLFVKDPGKEQLVITHGDCEDEAREVANLILEKYPEKEFLFSPVGPVIGSHSGPGTIALFFIGKQKDPTKKA